MARHRNPDWRSRIIIWALFGSLLLLGLGILVVAGLQVSRHIASQQWQPVTGTLLARGYAQEQSTTGVVRAGGTRRVAGRFAYEWQGQRHESEQVSFSHMMSRGWGASDMDGWDRKLSEYLGNTGDRLQVWVNPAAPQQAVALRDLRWLEIGLMLGFGLLATWVGWLFVTMRDPHREKPAFSWRVVATMWVLGALLAVLVPLLWRDGHPLWACAAGLPLLLALHGTVYGLRHRKPAR